MLQSRLSTLPLRAMSPHPDRFPFLGFDSIIPFAHRGGTDIAPENTVASFDHAVSIGYRYLETDVHRTADGVLVAFHDDKLERLAGDPRSISEVAWDELSEISFSGHTIPRLSDLLERFPESRFNIDPKADSAVEPLVATIREFDAIDRVCVGAFSDRRLATVREMLGPKLCTSPGPRATTSALLPWPLPGDHPCVSVPNTMGAYRLGRRAVRRFQSQGYRVHVWTVNDEAEMHRLIDLEVDGIMTDACALLKKVLQARGRWID